VGVAAEGAHPLKVLGLAEAAGEVEAPEVTRLGTTELLSIVFNEAKKAMG
jgi:hypothetical protein